MKRSKTKPTVSALGETWEYVVGNTYIAVRLSPQSRNFSPVYSFVMDVQSEDHATDVRREIKRRVKLLNQPLAEAVNG